MFHALIHLATIPPWTWPPYDWAGAERRLATVIAWLLAHGGI